MAAPFPVRVTTLFPDKKYHVRWYDIADEQEYREFRKNTDGPHIKKPIPERGWVATIECFGEPHFWGT